MDPVSTAFSIIGKGISVVKFIWKMVESVKDLQKNVGDIQLQLNVLLNILGNMKRSDSLQDHTVHGEVHAAVQNLDAILEEAAEICASFNLQQALDKLKSFQGEDEKFLRKLFKKIKQAKDVTELVVSAEKKIIFLQQLDKRLKLALSILQVAFSYTHAKNLHQLAVELTLVDNTVEVYTNPSGDPPRGVNPKSIKAEVSKQRLIVTWEDDERERNGAKRYEVSYHETKRLSIPSAGTSVAIGLQHIKPWQNYAIQVRAVNDAGASPWSFPPVYVKMNEGPPSRPVLRTVEATDRQSLKVIADKPPDEQRVDKVYVEKRIISETSETSWERETYSEVTRCYMLRKLNPTNEYVIRIRYQNEFDISEPSGEIPVKIDNTLPSVPTDLKIHSLTKTAVSFTQENFGAVGKYRVQLGENAMWQDIEASKIVNYDGDISFPLDITIDQIKAGDLRIQAVAKNCSVNITAPISRAKSVKSKERVNVPARMKFCLVRRPAGEFTNIRMKSFVSLVEATRNQPTWLTFETFEVTEPKNVTFETLEVPDHELTVSTTFSDSDW